MMRAPFAMLFAALGMAAASGPNFHEETLHYNVNWPSGLSLGEVQLRAENLKSAEADRWRFRFEVDAALPGFAISDRFTSLTSDRLCTLEFERATSHGNRKSNERTTVNAAEGFAERVTLNGGGKSKIPVTACTHDALAFLYELRRQLAQGRIPPPQTILFGAPYQLKLEYAGAQPVESNGAMVEADRFAALVKGPASELRFELFMSRDPARVPLLVRLPLSMGTFSMELVR